MGPMDGRPPVSSTTTTNFRAADIVERAEPAEVRAAFAASPGLAHDGFVLFGAFGRAELHRAFETRLDLLGITA